MSASFKLENYHKIVIVGAGVSGLTSAYFLNKFNEDDFIILEARNRIGGRVISIPFGGENVELGAKWLHGILCNPLFEFSCKCGLIDINATKAAVNIAAVSEDGHRIPLALVEQVYDAYFSMFKDYESYFTKNNDVKFSVGVGQRLQQDINKWLTEQKKSGVSLDILRNQKQIFMGLISRECCCSGCHSLNDLSLLGIGSYEELPGGNVTLPRGFNSIIDKLVENFKSGCIMKNHAVKMIKWNPAIDQTFNEGRKSPRIEISCENGATFLTDHVVITIPLGCLKENVHSMFVPPLPDEKIEAIKNLGFGTVNKIYLEYDRVFLNPEINEILLLWKESDMTNIEKNWFRKLYSFTKISDTVLLTWISGKEAEYMETLNDDVIAVTCTEILSRFLLDPYIPKPIRIVRTTWFNQTYTKGSYTYVSVTSTQEDIKRLAAPIYSESNSSDHSKTDKPLIMFAGEATHSTFYSTTHGAFMSGKTSAVLLSDEEYHENPSSSYSFN